MKFEGVKTCGDFTQPTPPPAPSACLCVFDIDRTLTGKQGLAEAQVANLVIFHLNSFLVVI